MMSNKKKVKCMSCKKKFDADGLSHCAICEVGLCAKCAMELAVDEFTARYRARHMTERVDYRFTKQHRLKAEKFLREHPHLCAECFIFMKTYMPELMGKNR
jgi:hypothetical protein